MNSMHREFLQLAQMPKADKDYSSYQVSEKFNGQRAMWDGGCTRGEPLNNVPWANTSKSGVSTGLWSRYGRPIYAPAWWLDEMPGYWCDGELWVNRKTSLQDLRSTTARLIPDDRWCGVLYMVFQRIQPEWFAETGLIKNPIWTKFIEYDAVMKWASRITGHLGSNKRCIKVQQYPYSSKDSFMENVLESGGEGIMLTDPSRLWSPHRTDRLIKIKPEKQATATIIEVIPGKGRHRGRMGALKMRWKGLTFNIGTGFTDEDRERTWSIGSTLLFTYRDVTNSGKPIEARYGR